MARAEQIAWAARIALGADARYAAQYTAADQRVDLVDIAGAGLPEFCEWHGAIYQVTQREWLDATLQALVSIAAELDKEIDIAEHLRPAFDVVAERPVFVVTPAGRIRCTATRDLGRALDFATSQHMRAWVQQDNAPENIEDAPTAKYQKPVLRVVSEREGNA